MRYHARHRRNEFYFKKMNAVGLLLGNKCRENGLLLTSGNKR